MCYFFSRYNNWTIQGRHEAYYVLTIPTWRPHKNVRCKQYYMLLVKSNISLWNFRPADESVAPLNGSNFLILGLILIKRILNEILLHKI